MRYYTTTWFKKEFQVFNRYYKIVILFYLMIGLFDVPLPAYALSAPIPPFRPSCRQRLDRPIAANTAGAGVTGDRPSQFYPYGSTGQGQYPVHHGVEFVNPIGTPTLAVADGRIVVAGTDDQKAWGPYRGYYGQLIVLQLDELCNDQPVYALYGHLSRILVQAGQRVQRGKEIGQVGMSGIAIGPHLHFEVRVGENSFWRTRNPELWFAPLPGHGTVVGRVKDEQGKYLEGVLITFHPVARPNQYWREAWTYTSVLDERLGRDRAWRENLVMGDVPAGEYVMRVRVGKKLYTRHIVVHDRGTALISVRVRTASNLPKPHTNDIILEP